MKRTIFLTAATVSMLALCGCNEDQQNADGSLTSGDSQHSLTVIASLRPKASPEMMEKIRQEEEARRRKEQEAIAKAAQDQQQQNAAVDPANRDLPAVDQSPISQIAGALGFGGSPQPSGQIPSPPSSTMPMPGGGMGMQVPTPPPMSYGGGYPSMGGAGGLIPPPPAVSLSTQASPYSPPPDPYQQAYMGGYNPYANPYPAYQPPPAVAQSAHPQGSMFSNGGSSSGSAGAAPEEKKRPQVTLITPTGMEARSPYKQRDELKVLIKGAFASAPVPEIRDPKINVVLARTDVGLPGESTKGNISLSQRQIDSLFKTPPIDKRVLPTVKKIENDVAQAYYRYLYSYNKFMFTQQQVAARKQEMDIADTNSEKQRAAADLSTAQNDADSAKDDMRAAQTDLASVAGVAAARSVIKTVSGQSPSAEALAAAMPDNPVEQAAGGILGSMQNAFGALEFWKKGGKPGGEQVAEAPAPKPVKEKGGDADKKKKDKKGGKSGSGGGTSEIASASGSSSSASSSSDSSDSAPVRPAVSQTGISFELKNVQTTPRKSVLKVTVRNNGGGDFNLDPDVISVIEGDHKLADAAVRAEFDSTLVGPNQEVTGTITIFGRPWNDKLIVSLSDGGKTIQLHR